MQLPMTSRVSGASPLTMVGILIIGFTSLAGSPAVARQNAILEKPQDHPTLAALTGEAMLLHTTPIGDALLYVEQNAGERLAILDVTDPQHIKTKGTALIHAGGAFEFVRSLSDREELIQFHEGHKYGILDLHRQYAPTINVMAGTVEPLAGTILTGETALSPFPMYFTSPVSDERSVHDYTIVVTGSTRGSDALVEVKGVRQEISNAATGTTFLMTDDGLYVVRRPQLERAHAEEEFRTRYN